MTKKLTRYELWFWKWKHSGWWFRLFQSFQVVGYVISFFCIIPLAVLCVAWSFLEGLYSRGLVYPVQVIASIVTNPLQLWLSPDRPASWLTLQFYRADDGGKIFREKETWWGRGFEKPACEDDQ